MTMLLFQFQYGAIKSFKINVHIKSIVRLLFQFQYGAIKSVCITADGLMQT